MSLGADVAAAIPKAIPANAPVIKAFPCLRASNFSPLALKLIHDDKKPPPIPARTEAIITAVSSTNFFLVL